MHRIMLPDGSHRQSVFLRWVRSLAYVLMATAGVLLVLSNLMHVYYGPLGEAMSWFLIVGGILSAVGAATNRWAGEFSGLPLLAPAFAVFGVLVWRTSNISTPFIAAANLSLLMAIAFVMMSRWRVVFAVYKLAHHLGDGGGRE